MKHQARPFLKWAGGKARLLEAILSKLPPSIRTYREPFLGGGAVFFALAAQGRFERAVLSDRNPDLIDAWRGVQLGVEQVIHQLSAWERKHGPEQYYQIRAAPLAGRTAAYRAARIIYLNKTCYNGLYRVNRAGEFNVPFGRYEKPAICDADNLRAASAALQKVDVRIEDFETAAADAERGDAIYFDPPYLPVSATSNFAHYHAEAFGDVEHVRLARVFRAVPSRGVTAVLSNSDAPLARKLYAKLDLDVVPVRRSINSNGAGRGPVSEILVTAAARPAAARPAGRSRAPASL